MSTKENLKILLEGGKLCSDVYGGFKFMFLDEEGDLIDEDGHIKSFNINHLKTFKPYNEPVKVYVHVYKDANNGEAIPTLTLKTWEELQISTKGYENDTLIRTIVLGGGDD